MAQGEAGSGSVGLNDPAGGGRWYARYEWTQGQAPRAPAAARAQAPPPQKVSSSEVFELSRRCAAAAAAAADADADTCRHGPPRGTFRRARGPRRAHAAVVDGFPCIVERVGLPIIFLRVLDLFGLVEERRGRESGVDGGVTAVVIVVALYWYGWWGWVSGETERGGGGRR